MIDVPTNARDRFEAMAALGIKRTKLNELTNDGRLKRVKVGGGTRITLASIRVVAGAKAQSGFV